MPIDKDASRRWMRRLRKVLNTEWAPIGEGVPDDEYDHAVGKIAAMIRTAAQTMIYLRFRAGPKSNTWACLATPSSRCGWSPQSGGSLISTRLERHQRMSANWAKAEPQGRLTQFAE
jgi:hypothetical protein